MTYHPHQHLYHGRTSGVHHGRARNDPKINNKGIQFTNPDSFITFENRWTVYFSTFQSRFHFSFSFLAFVSEYSLTLLVIVPFLWDRSSVLLSPLIINYTIVICWSFVSSAYQTYRTIWWGTFYTKDKSKKIASVRSNDGKEIGDVQTKKKTQIKWQRDWAKGLDEITVRI